MIDGIEAAPGRARRRAGDGWDAAPRGPGSGPAQGGGAPGRAGGRGRTRSQSQGTTQGTRGVGALAQAKILLDARRTGDLIAFCGAWINDNGQGGDKSALARMLRYCGDGLRYEKRYDEAIAYYSRSALFEDGDWTQFGLADCLLRSGRKQEAADIARQLIGRVTAPDIFDKAAGLAIRAGLRSDVERIARRFVADLGEVEAGLRRIAAAAGLLGQANRAQAAREAAGAVASLRATTDQAGS